MQNRAAIFAVCLLVIFVFHTNASAQQEGLELDNTTINIACPPGVRSIAECDNDWIIKVKTQINKPLKNPRYEYSVSGGKIIGTGKAVEWSAESLRPGTYTITAKISADDDFLQTFSERITVAECAECGCGYCECPNVAILASTEKLKSENIVTFAANITGGTQAQAYYKWKVSSGKIIEGQETPIVKVQIKGSKAKEVTATLNIDGLCVTCKNAETLTVKIK